MFPDAFQLHGDFHAGCTPYLLWNDRKFTDRKHAFRFAANAEPKLPVAVSLDLNLPGDQVPGGTEGVKVAHQRRLETHVRQCPGLVAASQSENAIAIKSLIDTEQEFVTRLQEGGFGEWQSLWLARWTEKWQHTWQLHREFDVMVWRVGVDRDDAAREIESIQQGRRANHDGD